MVGNDVTDKLKSRYFEDFIKSFNKPNEFDTPYTLALCNPTFTYPHIVKTKSSSTERTISLKNENSISETSYDRDMIGFHWNYKRKQFDIIQAVIMNCNFNEVEPTTINSATLLGHGYVEKDKYLTQINETFTQDQIDTPGIFEHIYNTTTYKFLAECGLISDRHYNMLIVDDSEYESFDFESNENELLRKDLELNGIQIYTVKADVEKHRASKSIIYIKNLNVPENENDLISSLVSLLHKQGGYNRTIENSLTKLKLY